MFKSIISFYVTYSRVTPFGVTVNVLDCGNVVSEIVLQSRYYIYFQTKTLWKNMNPFILINSYGLNSTTVASTNPQRLIWHEYCLTHTSDQNSNSVFFLLLNRLLCLAQHVLLFYIHVTQWFNVSVVVCVCIYISMWSWTCLCGWVCRRTYL